MNILFFNMIEYRKWIEGGIPNRNRHVFFNAEKRKDVDRVVAVDFLPFTYKRALHTWKNAILQKNKGRVVYQTAFDVMVEVSEKRYVFTSVRSVRSEDDVYVHLKKALQFIGFKPDILWSYYPYFVGYFDAFSDVPVKVFDAVDDWTKHENFKKDIKRLTLNYQKITAQATHIFTVSEGLLQLFKGHDNAHWIPNGVDSEHFKTARLCRSIVLDEINALERPIMGYVGIMQSRVDFNLVARVAKKYPQYSFVFVGPVWPDADISPVSGLQNVRFVGKVSYAVLPHVIRAFDIGIIPHKVNAFTASMNPLKLYEYLSVGLPVVTTPVAGLEAFKNDVFIADADTFADAISKAIKTAKDLHARKRREEAVDGHTWKARLDEMFSKIGSIV